ncbi:hypothetical protein [Roseomonas gilardii]|uniref:hypothetical protein n=1 Tax=Roseomonas gilardii TaxID=257708 RepID=UPI0012EC5AED|nr:hypothetical protein [Roseomonas gilardii]
MANVRAQPGLPAPEPVTRPDGNGDQIMTPAWLQFLQQLKRDLDDARKRIATLEAGS